MIGVVSRIMERGQITLPKDFRVKLGITSSTLLNLVLENSRIIITPLEKTLSDLTSGVISPEISKKEYLKKMKSLKGSLWDKGDDLALKEMEKKERVW